MERSCDLHTHSVYSDGTMTPAELICMARERGLSAVALCDHNTVDGLTEFLAAGKGSGVEPVPGIEFSTDYRDTELHILGLFFPYGCYDAVTEKVREMTARKERSNIALVEGLRTVGICLDYESIKAGTPNGQVNRAVIAAEMVRLGYCGSIREAFHLWLSPERGFYRPPKRLDAFEVIRFLKSIGAVSVLAHPFLNLTEGELREFLEQAVAAGLDGMEVFYSTFTPEQTAAALALAEEFGLLLSGGSDFHGQNKPDIPMGVPQVPWACYEKLKVRAAQNAGLVP